jgi:hypothetical protein
MQITISAIFSWDQGCLIVNHQSNRWKISNQFLCFPKSLSQTIQNTNGIIQYSGSDVASRRQSEHECESVIAITAITTLFKNLFWALTSIAVGLAMCKV